MAIDMPLINKYRPSSFEEFFGNEEIVGSLHRALNAPSQPHSYLLTGPSGIGKTTMARIIAKTLEADVMEIDAASNNGIEAMRELVELGNYASLSGRGKRMFIIDECHMLSRSAWNAILKLLEEPPAHLYIALCTTERNKVLETIVTRCFHISLRPIKPNEMQEFLDTICEIEGWSPPIEVVSAVVQAATGQPRKALSLMQAVHDVTSRDEVFRIISLMEASEPMTDLLKALLKGVTDWTTIQALLGKVEEDNWDEAMVGACRYVMAAMLTGTATNAKKAWGILDALVFPNSTFDKKAAFFAAVGRIHWDNN